MSALKSLICIIFLLTLLLAGCSDSTENNDESDNSSTDSTLTSPLEICDEPIAWSLPAVSQVIGDGSAASCTEDALREAVANGGLIRFNCGIDKITIQVKKEIEINQLTFIDGEGYITLDGGGTSRIIHVSSKLSVRNLHFKNGNAKGDDENGGAISGDWRSQVEVIGCIFEDNTAGSAGGAISVWTGSSLTVVASQFLRNTSGYGGAIYSLWSPLHIVNSKFIDNSTYADAEGGAIGTDGALDPDYREEETVGGTIEICGSVFQNNQATGAGGAAYIWAYPPDKIIIDRCTIENNILTKNSKGLAMGGGMRISNGEITIKATSFISNSAETHGGALFLDCEPTCTITNTTFYSNQVTDGFGGAIFGDKLRINNVTFVQNFASGHGGALFGGEDWILKNSIFADNTAGNAWKQAYSCAAMGSGDHVLQWVSEFGGMGSDSCIAGATAADPLLLDLADNGGPTLTLLPNTDSPAIDAGQGCEPVDQRGEPRDTSACDLGAVERP